MVRAGLGGSPRAVLVHGEAGIGKTTLVRSVCEQAAGDGAQVLWGQSLRFGTVEAMYHPLVLALEGWLGEADDAGRASIVDAVPGAALILPSLGASPADRPSALMMVVDALLNRVIARGPTVLVVDDVQWADPATWDALSYLVAGFGHQRLVLLTTHRDEAAGSDLFQHWLGNVRRLPGTEELVLTRLDEAATGAQVAALLGRSPANRLVEQVFERSRGNPYFSELLVLRGDLGSDDLPDDLPDELSQALLGAWRGMSPAAREITGVLAIAGRPTDLHTLTVVASEVGNERPAAIREAVDAGVILLARDGVWFRHPLLAGMLAESHLPGEAAPLHAAWAAHLASVSSDGVDELRRLGDLATHQERAGAGHAAFNVLLRGADLAEELGAPREAADMLARATRLWEASADPADTVGRAALLERAAAACRWVGRAHDGFRMLCSARDLVPAERDPLWASQLMARVARRAFDLGEVAEVPLAEFERAVELSRVEPESRAHAENLSDYADALSWVGRKEEARRVIEGALAYATSSGSAAAVSRALGVRTSIVLDTDLAQADVDSKTSWEQAVASGERYAIGEAYMSRLWVILTTGDMRRIHEHAREIYRWSVTQGMTVFPSVLLTEVLLAMGELHETEIVLRRGLSGTGSPGNEAVIRVRAGVLAVRRGAPDTARGHLARVHEIMPGLEERPEQEAGAPLAEVLLGLGEPGAAFELVQRILPVNAVDPRVVDELMVWGARAAADLVQRASDDRDQASVQAHREGLTRLVKTRATLPGIAFQPSGPEDTVQPARSALFAAESGRVDGVEDQVGLWRDAAAACIAAGLGWDQQLGSWRLASALVESGTSGTEAAELLRGVHEYSVREGAAPLQAGVEELAASARISLTSPRVPSSGAVPAAFTGLTPREAEVLAHLVANRTNAEIAQTLFISEKTVSVHVSNLLRKTATGSRREVAALARRVGWGTSG